MTMNMLQLGNLMCYPTPSLTANIHTGSLPDTVQGDLVPRLRHRAAEGAGGEAEAHHILARGLCLQER